MTDPKVTKVYVATMSYINGLDRLSFSQTINHLVEENPDVDAKGGNFSCKEGGIPANHILGTWAEKIADEGWWMSWMENVTDIALYIMDYIEQKEDIPPAS